MIRTLALIKRRRDLDRDAFRNHYETVHAPLALPLMEGLCRYVRYHVRDVIVGEPGFDVLSAFWYRDADATARLMERLASEEGRPIHEDEEKFMDRAANQFVPVSERPLVSGEEGDAHDWLLLARPDAVSRTDFSRRFVRDDWPSLTKGAGSPPFALLRDAFPMEGRAPRFDLALQVSSDSLDLSRFAAQHEATGGRAVLVRTQRFETDLDPT